MRIAQDDSGGGREKTPPVPVAKILFPTPTSVEGRVTQLHWVVLFSYLVAAVVCGFVTHFSVRTVARSSAVALFESVANQTIDTVHERLQVLERSGQVVVASYRNT
jgi:hypothetical protein